MKRDHTKTPLIEAIGRHQRFNPISFHVPGHKNGLLIDEELHQGFLKSDLTELSGLDDLHDAHDAIKESEELLQDFYGTKKSHFLVNGSTVGNLAAILAGCSQGDVVLVQRNCHKSVLNGIRLARAVPVIVETYLDEETKIPLGVSLESIQQTLKAFPYAKACVLTYPTYYGFTYQLEEIINELHKMNVQCIIDEAHGPHFVLGEPFPHSAIQLGADIVIQSAHKMLPAMTMGSYLHITSDRVNQQKVKEFLTMLQSSSPSYPIMASLDYARSYLATVTPMDIDRNFAEIDGFIQGLEMVHPQISVKRTDDPLKIMLRLEGRSGYELQQLLESAGIFSELADPVYVLWILPLLKNTSFFPYKEVIQRTRRALENQPILELIKKEVTFERTSTIHYTKLALSFEEMDEKEERLVPLSEAEGEISSQMVTPYPPGIPLLIPGERISQEALERLCYYVEHKVRIQGFHRLDENSVFVYR